MICFKETPQYVENNNDELENKEETCQEFLENMFDKNQLEFLNIELDVGEIELDYSGKIISSEIDNKSHRKDVQEWGNKDGIIDAKDLYGLLVLVYNSDKKIPEGCKDLSKEGRSGAFEPGSKVCFIDLKNSWSYVNERYMPSWVEQYVRHELRHGLVEIEDEKYSQKNNTKERRNLDWDYIEERNPENICELAYLDELHSQYFESLEGYISGKKQFRKIESETYNAFGEGSHLEIASQTSEGKKAVEEMFYLLQGMLLLKRMSGLKEILLIDEITKLTYAAGVVLATERSVVSAKEKIKLIWDKIVSNSVIRKEFNEYIKEYKPSLSDDTPEITEKLKKSLSINV